MLYRIIKGRYIFGAGGQQQAGGLVSDVTGRHALGGVLRELCFRGVLVEANPCRAVRHTVELYLHRLVVYADFRIEHCLNLLPTVLCLAAQLTTARARRNNSSTL